MVGRFCEPECVPHRSECRCDDSEGGCGVLGECPLSGRCVSATCREEGSTCRTEGSTCAEVAAMSVEGGCVCRESRCRRWSCWCDDLKGGRRVLAKGSSTPEESGTKGTRRRLRRRGTEVNLLGERRATRVWCPSVGALELRSTDRKPADYLTAVCLSRYLRNRSCSR